MTSTDREDPRALGEWFHNLHLPDGRETAPDHWLGDFPRLKWDRIAARVPADLTGWRCLDIGCNAGFYSFELARRGGDVLGIDLDERYLAQARWAAERMELERTPRFERRQVHELAGEDEPYDLVLFLGVFYHLRYPLLALDTVARLVRRLLVFQSLTTDDEHVEPTIADPAPDYPLEERPVLTGPGWPRMAFIEHAFASDPTNWVVPDHAALEALLRSTGFETIDRIEHETYLCAPPAGGVESRRWWDDEEWRSATGARPPWAGGAAG